MTIRGSSSTMRMATPARAALLFKSPPTAIERREIRAIQEMSAEYGKQAAQSSLVLPNEYAT